MGSRIIKHSPIPTLPTRSDRQDWMLSPHNSHGGLIWHPMHLFSQYGEKAVTNSILEESLAGEAVGSETLISEYFSYQGKIVNAMAMGYWEKASTSDLTLRVRMTDDNPHEVTIQDTGDTVTRVDHDYTTSTEIKFSSITGTTGIVINTVYWAITITTNTFQLSLTKGGTPIALTTNGTGLLSHSTIIHQKIFSSARIGNNSSGHWEISTMTTAVEIGRRGSINMHGMLALFENDSAEILGKHSENFILKLDTIDSNRFEMTAQWSVASALNKITCTNYMIM